MSHEVYADGNEIAGKAGINKVIASFPDVCLSPPSPPAGPIPVPYPNTSFSKDLKEGSSSVKLGGDPAALAQQSYYKTSPLGDEPATRALGMNVINHTITGKTYFQAWSMDVKIEGKNACRHVDITTSNHMSGPAGTPTPNPGIEAATMARILAGECPCCGATPLHDNQQNGDPKTEAEWYGIDDDSMKKLEDAEKAALDDLNRMKAAQATAPPAAAKSVASKVADLKDKHDAAEKAYYERLEVKDTIDEMRKMGCRNVTQPPDKDCGTYFAIHTHPDMLDPTGAPIPGVPMNLAWPWDAYGKARYQAWYNTTYPTRPLPSDHKVHHATPVSGGGCPLGGNPANSYANVVPEQDAVDPKCNTLDKTVLEKAQADAKKRWLRP
jgi:hypothetical protein